MTILLKSIKSGKSAKMNLEKIRRVPKLGECVIHPELGEVRVVNIITIAEPVDEVYMVLLVE